MPEILSQQEIDNLLSGMPIAQEIQPPILNEENKSEKEVVVFDFRLPHRLSKNQLRTMQAIHESFGEAFGSYLVSRLQTTVNIGVSSVDQLFYSEYVLSVPSPSCLYVFKILESDALGILEFSPQLVLAMVSRLLGGSTDADKKPRLITRIEQSIMKGIIQRALSDLQKSWKTIAALTFKQERYESEGDFAQIAPTSEIVMVVSLEVSFGEQKHLMNFCFPTFALEDVLAKLNVQHYSGVSSTNGDHQWTNVLTKKIEQTSTEAVGALGRTSITLRELMNLETGKIIRTKISERADMELHIGGITRFWGEPGTNNGRMAMKINKTLTEMKEGEHNGI